MPYRVFFSDLFSEFQRLSSLVMMEREVLWQLRTGFDNAESSHEFEYAVFSASSVCVLPVW